MSRPGALRAAAALAVTAATVAACGDTPAEPAPLGPCAGPVAVTLEFFPQPTVSWTPACGVARLTVAPPLSSGFNGPTWAIASASSAIRPPVTYGVVPAGAVELQPASQVIYSGSRMAVSVSDAAGTVLGTAVITVP